MVSESYPSKPAPPPSQASVAETIPDSEDDNKTLAEIQQEWEQSRADAALIAQSQQPENS